jgi:hypothetical protein
MSKVNLISGMKKSASPAWIRALAAGKISANNISKLTKLLPEGKTRLLKDLKDKPKFLGAGGEGRVYESFTGQHGPSALKIISQKGSLRAEKRIEDLKNLFSSSDIYPTILSTLKGGRGYALPRLLSNPPPGKALQELLGTSSSNKKQWLDFVNRFQKSTLEPGRVSISDAKRFGNYNAGGLPNSAVMHTANGPVFIDDIKGSGNIMFNQTGRPYLTDPGLYNI